MNVQALINFSDWAHLFDKGSGERLLQYIWQFQHFNKTALQTTAGEPLQIIYPGNLNTNQGPDFTGAQVKIGNTILAGSIELHLKSSQWRQHGHSVDPNYNNVVLHVVYQHNESNNPAIPVLELEPRISNLLLSKYASLMENTSFIACGHSITEVKELTWIAWKERLVAERLTRKSAAVFNLLQKTNEHWQETFWWLLARSFGAKVNADAFEALAQSITTKIIARHKNQIHQLEALLLGQGGLLQENFADAYPKLLQREYAFLKQKYSLQAPAVPVYFLRMRPGNFPTIRLAQLAMLLHRSEHLFTALLETDDVNEWKKLFKITANDYWHYHYKFDEASAFKKKNIGAGMIENIIINAAIPVLFAYGLHRRQEQYKTKALAWLQQLAPENNTVTHGFEALQQLNASALDSQAFIELKTQYCDQKNCLKCAVGNALLKKH